MGDVGDIFRALNEERREERDARFGANHDAMAETKASLTSLGLTLDPKSSYHFHIVRIEKGRRVLVAQWWPSSGRTMDGQRRGQLCTTGKALIAWLRDKEARRG